MEDRHFEFNWDEDLQKIIDITEVPEGCDKTACVIQAITTMIGA